MLGFIFWVSAKVFDYVLPFRPSGEEWDIAYFCGAATVDWILYRITPLFVEGKLSRDVEALLIASITTHALGFALYMAFSPPSIHNWIIQGINYVLAIRLFYSGGCDAFTGTDCLGAFRRTAFRRSCHVDARENR